MARVDWPTLPTGIVVEEMRAWWDGTREPWTRKIHGFYRTLGKGVTWPVRAAWENFVTGPRADPLELFRRREREAILSAVGGLLDELHRLAEVGNETLKPRLQKMLGGHAREELLKQIETAHDALPAVDEDYRTFLRTELDAWRKESPKAVRFLQSLDHLGALARPAISVGLFFTGLHFAGDLVGQAAGQAAVHAATQSVGQVATEAAITGGIAGGGEAILGASTEGVRQAAGRLFRRFQERYAQERARWLAEKLEKELLGDLLNDLRSGAAVPDGDVFHQVESTLDEVRKEC
jgi:hypothetical protein